MLFYSYSDIIRFVSIVTLSLFLIILFSLRSVKKRDKAIEKERIELERGVSMRCLVCNELVTELNTSYGDDDMCDMCSDATGFSEDMIDMEGE